MRCFWRCHRLRWRWKCESLQGVKRNALIWYGSLFPLLAAVRERLKEEVRCGNASAAVVLLTSPSIVPATLNIPRNATLGFPTPTSTIHPPSIPHPIYRSSAKSCRKSTASLRELGRGSGGLVGLYFVVPRTRGLQPCLRAFRRQLSLLLDAANKVHLLEKGM